jgi:Flp pilus assembly secretin CpaC
MRKFTLLIRKKHKWSCQLLSGQTYRRFSGVALLAFGLMGCGGAWEVPAAKRTFGRTPQLPEIPAADETVRGEDDPAIVTLKVGGKMHEKQLGRADRLPEKIMIPTTNLQNVPVTAALEAVLAGTDISLSYQGGSFDDRLVTLLNLNGSLPKVVQRICSAARIFCVAREGNLELKEEQSFVIELPPIERATTKGATGTATNTIVDAISRLAGSKAEADEAGGNLIYTTNVEGQERVSKYLEQLRNGRPLVVVQMYIWEVSLDSAASRGIDWKNLKISDFGGNTEKIGLSSSDALAAVTGGVSMGAVLSGKISATVVANFLSTQGVVQTLSNPQLTFVSGSSAEFRVGGTRSYVSSVGQLSNTVAGTSTGSTGVGTNTVSTDKIETGLKINVNGSYESGVIFSTLALAITDLIKIDSVNTGSTTLQLPETTNRDFSTVLRMRPGDNVVLAGMTSARDDLSRDRFNVPVLDGVPLRSANTMQNRELVILLKPSLVFFSDDEETPAAKQGVAAPAAMTEPEASPVAAPSVVPVSAVPPAPAMHKPLSVVKPTVDKSRLQGEMGRIFKDVQHSKNGGQP